MRLSNLEQYFYWILAISSERYCVPIFGNYCKFHYDFSRKPQINKNIYCHVQNISTDNVFNFY